MGFVFIVSLRDCRADDVLGVGHALYDIYVECKTDDQVLKYIQGVNVEIGGCSTIESPKAKELSNIVVPSKRGAGGAVANVIAGMASLGGKVGIVAAVGNDENGRRFDQDLKKLEVDRFVTKVEGGITGVVYSIIAPDGERTMLTFPGVSSRINPDHVSIDRIREYSMLISEGYMLYDDNCRDLLKDTLAIAHDNKVKTVFTLSSPYIAAAYREKISGMLSSVDVLVGNEEEFRQFCQTKNVEEVYSLIRGKVAVAVITRGPLGADIITNEEMIHVPVVEPVEKVVDTTGAGDMFLAGFLYGQTHKMSIERSAALGNELAGNVIQQLGGRAEFDTKEILKKHA